MVDVKPAIQASVVTSSKFGRRRSAIAGSDGSRCSSRGIQRIRVVRQDEMIDRPEPVEPERFCRRTEVPRMLRVGSSARVRNEEPQLHRAV